MKGGPPEPWENKTTDVTRARDPVAHTPSFSHTHAMGVLLAGVVIGILAGWRFKHSHRAWEDWRRALAAIPLLRRAFYRSGWWSLVWLVAGIVVLWAVLRR